MLSWTYLSVDIKKSTRVHEQSSRTIALRYFLAISSSVFELCVFINGAANILEID